VSHFPQHDRTLDEYRRDEADREFHERREDYDLLYAMKHGTPGGRAEAAIERAQWRLRKELEKEESDGRAKRTGADAGRE